nr:UvrD-helicase domain-containing protein [Bacilli bacterium]
MITDGLNPEQALAVKTTEGPVLIIAGAGSGKTSVMTRRIAYLLEKKCAQPWEILAITFTNKAAKEMRERVHKLIGDIAEDIWISTFHAMCVKILRREAHKIGYESQFSILDASDQLEMIKQCMVDLNYDLKKFDPSSVTWKISSWKNALYTPITLPKGSKSQLELLAKEVFFLYQHKLKAMQVMDFDDLIGQTVALLETHEETRAFYQQKFRYIHVDEYQDTNQAQYRLLRLFADQHQNLCAVGDSDQAIYRWRGADISNLLNFETDFSHALLIKLEQNYRSTQTILNAANAVIVHNQERKEKKLWTQADEGEPIVIYGAIDQDDEAVFIIAKIQEHAARGGRFEDCTVLYRANALSRAIEENFMQAAIPYRILGGMTFYDRKEIKDVMAYLKVIANPSDEISLLRIINTPKRGIGDGTLRKLLDYAHDRDLTLLEAMGKTDDESLALSGKVGEVVKQFYQMIMYLKEIEEGLTVTEYVQQMLYKTQYREMYASSSKEEDQARLENIDELLTVTRAFDRRRRGTLADFLAETSLLSDIDKEYGKTENAVTLMTMHAAKGLEFPVVFVIGAEETLFPHARSLDSIEGIEEERNLCYVAITRAKKQLFISYCTERSAFGQVRMNDPSRFLAEIPDHLTVRSLADHQAVTSWSEGTKVRHPLYGVGVITAVEGTIEDVELAITFTSRHGTKSIRPKLTRLKILEN